MIYIIEHDQMCRDTLLMELISKYYERLSSFNGRNLMS